MREEGTVSRFFDEKGFGFITPDNGGKDVFCHHSEIEMEGFRKLEQGDRVEFEIVQDPKGPRASGVVKLED